MRKDKPKFKDHQVMLGRTTIDISLLPLDWFVKRPVLVKAMEAQGTFRCITPNGIVSGKKGDYIVIDIEGKAYPCKKSVFESTHVKNSKRYDPKRHSEMYP